MFVFIFDRICTGAPNITGRVWWSYLHGIAMDSNGALYGYERPPNSYSHSYSGHRTVNVELDASRSSSDYNSAREIRVKSIISNGYIKLF